jgi:hypothetical protein
MKKRINDSRTKKLNKSLISNILKYSDIYNSSIYRPISHAFDAKYSTSISSCVHIYFSSVGIDGLYVCNTKIYAPYIKISPMIKIVMHWPGLDAFQS